MIAIINLVRQAPAWLYGFLALVVLMFVIAIHERSVGADGVRYEWAAANASADAAQAEQIRKLTDQQTATAAAIQGNYDAEIIAVHNSIAAAPRMRLPAFCKPAAAIADTAGTQSGVDASAGSGLVSIETQRDFDALILTAEETAATARAAQEFIRANGMAE